MRSARRKPVPFGVRIPGAGDVRITGDFTEWTRAGIPLWNEGDGSWRTILSLLPGIYEYRLIIDGDWADHGEAVARVPNIFGGENCVLTVRSS